MKNNIVLIGFMGCGKTTIGKALAEELEYTFIDTDEYIEKCAGKTINEIFATNTEEYFRDMETETITDLMAKTDHSIVSTGGGLPLREVNADVLKKNGFVIYLKVSAETVESRLQGDTTRPLLQGDDVSLKIHKLLDYRDPLYEYGAHMVIHVDNKTVDELVEEIRRNYKLMSLKESEDKNMD